MAVDLSPLAPYANDPDVVAYLQALQAQQQQQTPTSSAVPFDAAYTQAVGNADTDYANTIAAIDAMKPGIQRTYGYNDSGDIDPNNPFGRAQLLQRSYQQSKRGINNSMAARGQLYSGATQRAQNDAQFNFQANEAALRNEYGQMLAGLSAKKADARAAQSKSIGEAYWNWVYAQLGARQANPAGTTAGELGGGSGGVSGGPTLGPDGTVLDPGAVAAAQGTGGTPGPAAPPYQYTPPTNPNWYKQLLPYYGMTTPPKAKGMGGATYGSGTGGARAPR